VVVSIAEDVAIRANLTTATIGKWIEMKSSPSFWLDSREVTFLEDSLLTSETVALFPKISLA